MTERNRETVCAGVALLVSALFFVCALKLPALAEGISSIGNSNILVYGMTLVMFCLVFMAGLFFTKRASFLRLESAGVKRAVLTVLLAGTAVFLTVMVAMETGQYGGVADRYVWHTQPFFLALILFVLEAAAFLAFCSRSEADGKKADWLVWAVYGVLTVLVLYSMDTPNLFGRSNAGDSFHGHAYFNSIYNVYMGLPFAGDLTSIYGHYALLWKLPMKLIGGDFRMFVFLQAVLSALTHLCAFLVLHQLTKKKVIRILGAIAITLPILGLRGGYYWQVWPHRMVFPMFLLLYAVWYLKKKKSGWLWAALGYGICVLAVVWNTETGMILAVAWAGMHVCRMFCAEHISPGKTILGILLHGIGVAASFLGAWGLVNVYNFYRSSPANSIKQFLVPLLSDSYMVDVLHLEIPLFPCGYMGEIALFLLGVAMGIVGWKCFRKEKEGIPWTWHLIFFLSVSGLGRLVYYMNRPAYHNLDCCHFSAVILLAFFAERGISFQREKQWQSVERHSFHELMRGALGVMSLLTMLALATGTVLLFSQNSEIKENYHNTEEFDELVESIGEYVPENTFAFGLSVPEIYSALHWNTNCFTMDFSDLMIAPESARHMTERLQTEEIPAAFTSERSMGIWEKYDPEGYQWFLENYVLDKTFPAGGVEFQYYIKK